MVLMQELVTKAAAEKTVKPLVDLSRFRIPKSFTRMINDQNFQQMFKRRFNLPEPSRVIKVSTSVCPVCNRTIPMVVYEHDNVIWLKKTCPEHGQFLDIYWGDAELYYYFLQWDDPNYIGKGLANPNTDQRYYNEVDGCPFACGLCPAHKTNTALAIIDVTNRCNMKCPVCFANAGVAGYVYEPSLADIERMMRILRSQRPWAPNALQLSGGEPTLRNDLPEIVRMAKKLGFDHVEVNTNGIRIANDINYYKALLDAGMSTLYLQFDTIDPNNRGVWRHRLYDPRAYAELRKRVIENARKLGHRSIVLVVTMAKNYNDKDIGKIIDFAVQNRDVVRWINIQPVAFAGRAKEYSPEELRQYRITIPDVLIGIEEQTNGKISRWDWRPVNWPVALGKLVEVLTNSPKPLFTNNPVCGASTFIYYDEDVKDIVPITKLVDVDGFEAEIWNIYNEAVKGGVHSAISKVKVLKLLKYVKHRAVKNLLEDVLLKKSYDALGRFMFNIVGLGIMHFMDTMNFDVQRIQRCDIHYAVPDGRIIPFCTLNNFHRDRIEHNFKLDAKDWVRLHPGKFVTGFA